MTYKRFVSGCLSLVLAALMTGCGKEEGVVSFSLQNTQVPSTAPEVSVTPEETPSKEGVSENADGTTKAIADKRIFVYVCGAVKVPGVYEMSSAARVYEALAAAGGCTAEASEESLNQAGFLEDGQRIYVPTKEEAANGQWHISTSPESAKEAVELVNINTADKDTLMTLPGIGDAKAESILSYRQQHGRFRSIEEIKEISGIKDSVFQQIKDRITV